MACAASPTRTSCPRTYERRRGAVQTRCASVVSGVGRIEHAGRRREPGRRCHDVRDRAPRRRRRCAAPGRSGRLRTSSCPIDAARSRRGSRGPSTRPSPRSARLGQHAAHREDGRERGIRSVTPPGRRTTLCTPSAPTTSSPGRASSWSARSTRSKMRSTDAGTAASRAASRSSTADEHSPPASAVPTRCGPCRCGAGTGRSTDSRAARRRRCRSTRALRRPRATSQARADVGQLGALLDEGDVEALGVERGGEREAGDAAADDADACHAGHLTTKVVTPLLL